MCLASNYDALELGRLIVFFLFETLFSVEQIMLLLVTIVKQTFKSYLGLGRTDCSLFCELLYNGKVHFIEEKKRYSCIFRIR